MILIESYYLSAMKGFVSAGAESTTAEDCLKFFTTPDADIPIILIILREDMVEVHRGSPVTQIITEKNEILFETQDEAHDFHTRLLAALG